MWRADNPAFSGDLGGLRVPPFGYFIVFKLTDVLPIKTLPIVFPSDFDGGQLAPCAEIGEISAIRKVETANLLRNDFLISITS